MSRVTVLTPWPSIRLSCCCRCLAKSIKLARTLRNDFSFQGLRGFDLMGKSWAGAGLDVLEEEEAVREKRELLSGRFDGGKLQAVLRNHVLAKHEPVTSPPTRIATAKPKATKTDTRNGHTHTHEGATDSHQDNKADAPTGDHHDELGAPPHTH